MPVQTTSELNGQINPWRFALAADDVNTSFASRIPTITQPTLAVPCCGIANTDANSLKDGAFGPVNLKLLPIAKGANNCAADMRLIAWNRTVGGVWVPQVVAEFAIVYGNIIGIAAYDLVNTYFLADTIVKTFGPSNCEVISPATAGKNDIAGGIMIDSWAAQMFDIAYDLGTNATGGNCLYAAL